MGFFPWTYRHKLFEADLLVLVGVSSDEGLNDLPHSVARQGEAGLPEKLLQLKVTHIPTVVNVYTHTNTHKAHRVIW